MPSVPVEQFLQAAIAHHMAGRFHDAEAIYRQILSVRPDHAQSLYLLGTIAAQAGRGDQALELMQRAASVDPRNPAYHNGLGILLQGQGRLDQAIASYQRALAVKADMPDVHFNLGTAWVQKVQLDTAIACFQHAVVLDPRFAQAHYNLGNAWNQKKDYSQAVGCFRKAIALQPDYADAHNNLAVAQAALGQWDQAVASYNKVISLRPDDAIAHRNLGDALRSMGQFHQAVASYQRAIALRPELPEAHTGLGLAWYKKGNFDEAIACQKRAIELRPEYAQAHAALGTAFWKKGQPDEAIACLRRALELDPESAAASNDLGLAWNDKGRLDQAIACFQRALSLNPDFVEAHCNLGIAFSNKGDLDQAIASLRRAIALNPNFAPAYDALGNALKDVAQIDAAIACYRRAVALMPGFITTYGNLLYAMNFDPSCDARDILAESLQWNHRHAQPLRRFIQPHANDRTPHRQLRIGYVSPDFRLHPVSHFMLPVLAAHDRHAVAVFCYSQVLRPDKMTAGIQAHADTWRDIVGCSDQQAADLIRHDQIDILVDLTGHSGDNRLLVFAHKPAPVQVTYLGFPGTTGLETIDYRLTDALADPPGMTDPLCSERLIRLPRTAWCFHPYENAPAVGDLPATRNGFVTFGSFNNLAKINEPLVKLWAEILRSVPGSRLRLKSTYLGLPSARQMIRDIMSKAEIDPDRVDCSGWVSFTEHLGQYGQIDIALDTYPYHGTTTTCDALWMGVPVVTRAGQCHVSRVGVSLLTNVGLPDLIAQTPEQYVQIATALAADRSRLAELRSTLRDRMQGSPLTDAEPFARDIEAAYRVMWQNWCAT